MSKKKELGQFMTTNYSYILQKLFIPHNLNVNIIIEPFCGNGDLLNFIDKTKYILELYDIEPLFENIIKRDTLTYPPDYNNKFILTNPPYLANNKTKKYSNLYKKYKVDDLYKCLIKELITNKPIGGILIIPLNFFCSIRKNDIQLRKDFLQIFNILQLNIFEEQIFNDTTYNVCSFQFELKTNLQNSAISTTFFPNKHTISLLLNDTNNYTFGGEIYNIKIKNKYKISRLTSLNKHLQNNNLLMKCIDDNINNKIKLSIVESNNVYIDDTPKNSARSYASFIILPNLNINQQKILVNLFNNFLEEKRIKYNSLFLTNYRETSKCGMMRKRISFTLIIKIISFILENNSTIFENDVNRQ